MAKLDIILAPDRILKEKAAPVSVIDDRVVRLVEDMLETMYAAPGIGLAANQVGVLQRVVVADCTGKDEPPNPYRMINPEVVLTSDQKAEYEEGCLSLPDHYAMVTRPKACVVEYTDLDGERRRVEAEGLLATCLQHEVDHLNGILFVDHLSVLKRNMILRKMTKLKRQRAA